MVGNPLALHFRPTKLLWSEKWRNTILLYNHNPEDNVRNEDFKCGKHPFSYSAKKRGIPNIPSTGFSSPQRMTSRWGWCKPNYLTDVVCIYNICIYIRVHVIPGVGLYKIEGLDHENVHWMKSFQRRLSDFSKSSLTALIYFTRIIYRKVQLQAFSNFCYDGSPGQNYHRQI